MILKRFYDENLAQASFLVGCGATGEAVVVDANRDVEQYIRAAASEGLRITAVTETHIHADYVSGSRELAERTGAQLYLSDEGDSEWKYAFANQPNVMLVRDGDSIRVGKVRLDVVKTPGHTPEHIAFIVTDTASSDLPLGAFTGDFIFVGDVGRPDLLERAAGFEGTMEKGARVLFHSLEKFKSSLPDSLLLWPAHGAGSACGKSLGGVPVSTLGYEKASNWGLRANSEDEFATAVLQGQPDPPKYFKEMKRINKVGPTILGGFKTPPRLGGNVIFDLLERDEMLIDVRSAGDVATGYVPGTINIPLGKSFTTWAGWFVPYDKPVYLIAESEDEAKQAARDLAMIGLDDVRGWLGIDALRQYEKRFGELAMVPQVSARELQSRVSSGIAEVVDVRGTTEYAAGHVPGATNIPLGYLPERASELTKSKQVVLHCGGGVRSAVAATILYKAGLKDVVNLPGGFPEYRDLGFPVETGAVHEVTTT